MTTVAILCPGYGLVARGIERVVEEITSRLDGQFAFEIFSRAPAGRVGSFSCVRHVAAIPRDSLLATLYAQIGHRLGYYLRTRIDCECLSFTVAAAPQLLRRKYDVIFNLAGPFAGWLCQLKRSVDGTPFLHSSQGQTAGRLEEIHLKQRPDVYLAVSKPNLDWVRAMAPGLDVRLLPNGVDTRVFSCDNGRAELSLRRPLVLYVGAMDTTKHPQLLLEAMSRMQEASLLMIGSGSMADDIRSTGLADLGAERFLLIEHVPNYELPSYYNACDIFSMPTPAEALGIAFLEAMACNKPVVAHRAAVQEWVIGDAGILCDCYDPNEYATALGMALATDFGDRPRRRALGFDWPAIVRQYAAVFEEFAQPAL